MKLHLTGLVALWSATAFMTGSALAAPTVYQLTDGSGFSSGDLVGSINYIGSPPGYPPVTFSGNVYIGPLNMLVTNETTLLPTLQTVYCTDIFNEYNAGGLYTLSATNLTSQFSAQFGSASDAAIKVRQITALLSNAPLAGPAGGAAIQAAIWEIANESGITGYNLTTGLFTASVDPGDEATFAADAATDLADVTGTNGSNGIWQPIPGATVWQYVVADVQSPNQSFGFLVASSGGRGAPVPEPASLGLLGLGVLGVTTIRRRRSLQQPT